MNDNIRRFRESQKLDPEEMAEKLGISTSYYYKLESGLRTPSFKILKRYKEVFGIEVDVIFFAQNMDETSNSKAVNPRHKRAG